ncbi:MAG: quinone oxidoreductase [Verrucomicrobia bacterium]|nr:quinone oxidoreductase [Verrucomicrobiota bacterium]
MKAIQVVSYGDVDCLEMRDVPKPLPKRGEVLIRLKAVGVNFIDIYMRKGDPMIPIPLPFTPGVEGSGIIEAVGEDVTEVRVGDSVSYLGSLGSYAEYAVVPVARTIPLRPGISFEEAAAFTLQGLTAQYLVNDSYKVKPGDNVLVHAAAGGVGLFLIQMLKRIGARVIGTVSAKDKGVITKSFGADDIIFYSDQDFALEVKRLTNGRGVDYIIDGVGRDTFTKNLEACCVRGHIVVFGHASGQIDSFSPNLLQLKSITLTGGNLMNYLGSHEELLNRAAVLMKEIKNESLKVHIDHVFRLEQAREAQKLLESRKSTGKIVLKIA